MKRRVVEEKSGEATVSKKARTPKHRHVVSELLPPENKEKPLELADSSVPETRRLDGVSYTVTIALPGSIVDGVLLPELKTYLAGQIGRAASVFCVDEIVVFDEAGSTNRAKLLSESCNSNSASFLSRVLQYLETPQYLRKLLFPLHPDLKFVGLLNSLDCPHHVKVEDEARYREGVVLDRPTKSSAGKGSFVECGLKKNVRVDKHIKPGVRVTVMMEPSLKKADPKYFVGKVVSPTSPRMEAGTYWGYRVRFAHSLGAIFTESPYEGGYDLAVGTSESGRSVDLVRCLPQFKHLLVVFGGQKGLGYSLECDEDLKVDDVSHLFDLYLNTCPLHGTKSIRPEEAIFITMSTLRPLITTSVGESVSGDL